MKSRISRSLSLVCGVVLACGGRDLAPPSNAPPPVAGGAGAPEWRVDPARSRVTVHVASSGVVGHDHHFVPARWTGIVRFDPAAAAAGGGADLTFAADSLHDEQPKISEKDRKNEIEPTVRGPDVLDAARYADVRFVGQRLVPSKIEAGTLSGTLVGTLILHGRQKEVAFPVAARWSEQELHATGEAVVRQTDFGIAPMSKMLGFVSVADTLRIGFDVIATREAAPPPASPPG